MEVKEAKVMHESTVSMFLCFCQLLTFVDKTHKEK